MLRFIDHQRGRPATDPLSGLLENPPRLSPAYFYDGLGARLFAAITELDEYYPTRLEHAILRGQAGAIAESVGSVHTMVDLGAGDCAKAMLLLAQLRPAHYVALDIAGDFLRGALRRVSAEFPRLEITGIVTDFAEGIDWPDDLDHQRPLFFYPGSSIGNFSPAAACELLRSLSRLCRQSVDGTGDLLIGIDLLKSPEVMQAAYDDALGVTASFNLNMLRHLNRVIGTNFDLRQFRHQAQFNVAESRIEMSLRCCGTQQISWRDGSLQLAEGDAILTEYSYKYTPQGFHRLLQSSGFFVVHSWFDETDGFMVVHARSA